MRWLFVVLTFFCINFAPARAAVYSADPTAVAAGFIAANNCFGRCPPFHVSALYSFQPGDVVDFGTLTLAPIFYDPLTRFIETYQPEYLVTFVPFQGLSGQIPNMAASSVCDRASTDCSHPTLPPNTDFRIVVTMPDNATNVQIVYRGDFVSHVAAVPEPSTWAMLLLGFAGIGLHRSRQFKTPTNACLPLTP